MESEVKADSATDDTDAQSDGCLIWVPIRTRRGTAFGCLFLGPAGDPTKWAERSDPADADDVSEVGEE